MSGLWAQHVLKEHRQNLAKARHAVTAAARTLRILRHASWHCLRPWRIAVTAPIVLNLVLLAPQMQSVGNFNESNLHVAMIRWAQRQISAGHIPLDGWFPNFSLGASQFHHYPSLPATLTAYLSGPLGAETTYLLSVYLLLSFWPLSVYWGARLMSRSRSEAAIAGLLSPLVMSAATGGFEPITYVAQGFGLWTQLWGMVLLPLALGLCWRAIEGRGRAVVPSIVIALTVACAFITGYMAFLGLGVFAIVVRERWRSRLLRAVLIGGGAALIASWVLVPLVSDQAFTTDAKFAWQVAYDSWGGQNVLTWLISGQLFDNGNLPVISVLAAVGAVVCIRNWRTDTVGRGLLVLMLLSLLLLIGPATFPLLKLLPAGQELQFTRFIGCVELTGLLLAGIGGRWVFFQTFDVLVRVLSRLRPMLQIPTLLARPIVPLLLLAASVAVVLSPTLAVINYETGTNTNVADQATANALSGPALDRLLTEVSQLDHGRVYAGTMLGWGVNYTIGYVRAFEELSSHDIDQVGYQAQVQSLSEDPEFFFDETKVADYQAFAVRYMVLPASMQPPVAATKVDSSGSNVLWEVNHVQPGYMRVVDTVAPAIAADRWNLQSVSQAVMQSTDFQQGLYQPVAYAGMPAAAPSLPDGTAMGSPGSVSNETDNLDNGEVAATVTATRPAVALLSASYDNRWTATVDGVPTPTQMIAPTLLGVAVPAGTHTVTFHYQPYGLYWLWFLVAIVTIALMFRFTGRDSPGTDTTTPSKPRS